MANEYEKKSTLNLVKRPILSNNIAFTITRKEREVMSGENFLSNARRLVGQEVEVITTEGTYTGTLLSVGSDTLVMQTRIRGRVVRLIIRLALIVALFRLIGRRGIL